ncbi:response regulator, partial [Escherichia coli]|uniref:response regulator n=1 Tax=Escherichia coli TaxID=562 RepID=UPI0020214978
MKLLIVEDEKKTGEYLTKGLTEAGFVVDLADNGLNGYHLAMTGDYDLIILDIMLPDVGNDSNLLIVFYVQIMPDDFVMQLHR